MSVERGFLGLSSPRGSFSSLPSAVLPDLWEVGSLVLAASPLSCGAGCLLLMHPCLWMPPHSLWAPRIPCGLRVHLVPHWPFSCRGLGAPQGSRGQSPSPGPPHFYLMASLPPCLSQVRRNFLVSTGSPILQRLFCLFLRPFPNSL